MLKFLCDEVLSSTLVREQLDQCVDTANELQQKIRSVILEWNDLKLKKDSLSRTSRETAGKGLNLNHDNHHQDLDLEKMASEDQTVDSTNQMVEIAPAEELNSLETEILRLEESFADLDSKLLKSTLRRDFLGRDSQGRMYWSMVRPRQRPWLLVDPSNVDVDLANHVICSSPFVLYESDQEIQELVTSLKESDSRERELKEAILHWQKLANHYFYSNGHIDMPSPLVCDGISPRWILLTRAAVLLANKYGPLLDSDSSDGQKKRLKMRRCECLELIWASRPHCLHCHQTFGSRLELDNHAKGGKCSSNLDNYESRRKLCPFDLKEITQRFVPKGSIEDLVNEIGLIGSNGVPSFVPTNPQSPSLDLIQDMDIEFKVLPNSIFDTSSFVSESSLRPVSGKSSQILNQLKINLLDMDAALPDDALRTFPWRRCAWRSLTKSAQCIYQVSLFSLSNFFL